MARDPMRNQRRARDWSAEVLARKGTRCWLCGKPGADSADHVIPVVKGGAWSLDNGEPAHRLCNSLRGDTDAADWFARNPLPHRDPLPPSRDW